MISFFIYLRFFVQKIIVFYGYIWYICFAAAGGFAPPLDIAHLSMKGGGTMSIYEILSLALTIIIAVTGVLTLLYRRK